MQKIIPHLWFDTQAKEAATFYTSLFPNSKITHAGVLKNTPSGDCDVMSFELMGYSFMSISAGPYFKINPSISLLINFDPSRDPQASEHIDELWEKLSDGGEALMPLDAYPFAKRYGWIKDKYGLTWQLMLTNPEGQERPEIIPFFLFVGENSGKAKEATDFYISVFKNSQRGTLTLYPEDMGQEKKGNVMFTDFMLEGQWFAAMESAMREHAFTFNEAVSHIVNCDTQEEIDYYWEKLSAVPEAEQCGWLKDKYGVSWQIVPTRMDEMMRTGTPEQMQRVTEAFLQMKKLDIETLEKAFAGNE